MKRIGLKLPAMGVVIFLGVLGLEHRVVCDLMDPFLNKNNHLFFNNFNSTANFFQDLEKERNLCMWNNKKRSWDVPS